MIYGWGQFPQSQQQAWLDNPAGIPDESLDMLNLSDLSAVHAAIFGEGLTVFGLSPQNIAARTKIIRAIKTGKMLTDSDLRLGLSDDADI